MGGRVALCGTMWDREARVRGEDAERFLLPCDRCTRIVARHDERIALLRRRVRMFARPLDGRESRWLECARARLRSLEARRIES